MRLVPVLIVGGGPAGAATALALATAGIEAEVIERALGDRDVVCGGFLSWSALRALRRLGIDPSRLGAQPIHRSRLISGQVAADLELPHAAAGLSRRKLDAALLSAAEEAGARIRRGRVVRRADPERRVVWLDDDEEVAGRALVLATGKHELRGAARALNHSRMQGSVGLRTELPATGSGRRALEGVVELHLFDEGYAGLLLQENGMVNVCLSVSQRRLSTAGGTAPLIHALVREAPLLTQRLDSELPEKWSAVAGVPYGWRARETHPGVFRTGDQAAVTASLVGDGLAVALWSGIRAAEALASGGADIAPEWQSKFARRSRLPLGLAEALRSAAGHGKARGALMRTLQIAPSLGTVAARLTRVRE